MKYKIGDRVRIVKQWADPMGVQNRAGGYVFRHALDFIQELQGALMVQKEEARHGY